MNNLILSIFNRIVLFLIQIKIEIKVKGKSNVPNLVYSNIEEIITSHFEEINEYNHPCKESLLMSLNLIDKVAGDIVIIETGSSAWGTNSSKLFDKFITYRNICKGGVNKFLTCDIRINPLLNLIGNVSSDTTLYCNDSVEFLKNISAKYSDTDNYFLIYLDSFDLDYFNPNPSGFHGFKEFLAILPLLKKGSILLIDDSPSDLIYCPDYAKDASKLFFEINGYYPGKGMFIDAILSKNIKFKKIFHKYQILYIIE